MYEVDQKCSQPKVPTLLESSSRGGQNLFGTKLESEFRFVTFFVSWSSTRWRVLT